MERELISVGIKSSGYFLPEQVIENSYFTTLDNDISEEWITSRTGIYTRRKALDREATSDMAYKAAKSALANAGMPPDELDFIILATSSPDMLFPSSACIVQNKIGATRAGAFDLSAACAGFIYGLHSGYSMVASGLYKNVMVIGAETLTRFVNWENKETSVLFGDGAGCVLISPAEKGKEIIHCEVGADGSGASILTLPAGGSRIPASEETVLNKLHCINMNGKETYKACIRNMTDNISSALTKCNLQVSDIDILITHQANKRIIEGIAKKLRFSEDKVYVNVTYLGNTAAASIPIGLAECMEQNKFKKGDNILLSTFGAGLTWGTCLIKW